PNVVAPGVGVRSSIPNGQYASFSGTSMSGPHTVGLVALIISANPELAGQVETIENIIELSAKPLNPESECADLPNETIPNYTYGYGRINAFNAINKALLLSPDNHTQNVRLFPNPFIDNTTFEIKNLAGDVNLEIYNISGQLLHVIKLLNLSDYELKTIKFSHLSQGLYIYKIKNSDTEFKGKFLKLY
ncbi:MAG TPA: T9SS type A sorting domain-containing protein, partial [Saprospiraceae bacterium]|nr:T9SS type A sorting domain-containing protein [Saprospiraceae bacterium]